MASEIQDHLTDGGMGANSVVTEQAIRFSNSEGKQTIIETNTAHKWG
jgi:hypothetical protein